MTPNPHGNQSQRIIRKADVVVLHVLVNRAAGNGRGKRVWGQLQEKLNAQHIAYEVSFPMTPEESAEHVRALISDESATGLLVVGGDGTVHSVLSAVVGSRLPVGIIPAGSGNDLTRALGLAPNDLDGALRLVTRGQTIAADVIEASSRYCITAIGAGIDGAVAHRANQSAYKAWLNRFRLGSVSYVVALLQTLLRYRPTRVEVVVDGREYRFDRVWLVAAANVPSYGGGMRICPDASLTDGLLDVCIVAGISRLELLRVFPRVYSGRHVTHPAIHFIRGREVSIQGEAPLLAHADGELLGTTPLHIRAVPAALQLYADEAVLKNQVISR